MVFGIQDLQKDVQKFKQDIEIAKAEYISDYTEYINIATDFENIEQKDDFLQQETELLTKIFPEPTDSVLSDISLGFLFASTPFDVVSGVAYLVKRHRSKKLMKILANQGVDKLNDFRKLVKAGSSPKLTRIINGAGVKVTAKLAKVDKAAKIARVTGSVGLVLGIIGIAFEITETVKKKEYLEEQKDELKKHLDDFNGYIAEANEETKNLIDAFLTYFNELEIDVIGVFNEERDGFLDEDGQQKFDSPDNGVVSQLRSALNGAVKRIGELNAAVRIANRRIDRYISQGLAGAELIEEVVFDTELPQELIQRLYIFKLRELGSTVEEAIELSGLAEDLVKKLYARGYLDDGKTVEETVALSGLTEDEVRRIFASKLLDDELNAENPDDVIDVQAIAEKVGLTKEIVREIRAQLLADLQPSSERVEVFA